MSEPVLSLHAIGKTYRSYSKPSDRLKQALLGNWVQYYQSFDALKSIDLDIGRGETVGIVGRNGSGKSTLLQIICGTLSPSSGTCRVNGRISALLELGAGFNPEFSGRENVFMNAAILGLSRAETMHRYDEIVNFSGLSAHHLQQPVKTYSSGMYVRLAFSVAIAVDPDILVVDEALAVGDEGFQRKCYARIQTLQEQGTTILFVSHAAQTVIELCNRAVLLDEGEVLCEGAPKDIISGYHRLIYAPRDKRPAIRDDLKRGNFSAQIHTAPAQPDALHSESRVVYEQHGGAISNVRIEDMNGVAVQELHMGLRYRFCYDMHLSEQAHRPKCGMLIKTKRGVELAGAVAEHMFHANETRVAGDVMRVAFTFDCQLLPGHYFLNCGCTKRVGDDEVFIHRIVDALQFKVTNPNANKNLSLAGQVNLNIAADICT